MHTTAWPTCWNPQTRCVTCRSMCNFNSEQLCAWNMQTTALLCAWNMHTTAWLTCWNPQTRNFFYWFARHAHSQPLFKWPKHLTSFRAWSCLDSVGNSSQASCLSTNSAMDDSIGDSSGVTGLRVQRTARPYESELLDLRPTLAR